jgi:beta-glucosidase
VVLETGNLVVMPWRGRVRAIVEAWYPGQAGGQALHGHGGRVLVTPNG